MSRQKKFLESLHLRFQEQEEEKRKKEEDVVRPLLLKE